MGGKTEIVQSTPPPQPTAAQSAAEYAQALPTILQTQLQYQPEFDQATFDAFQRFGPQYAEVARNVLEQYSPNLASLDEKLAQQALNLSEQGLTEQAKNLYRDEFKSLLGNQAASGIGADFIGRNLVREQLAAQAQGQNLGLAIQGKVPISQAFQQPSQFQVASGFLPSYQTSVGGFSNIYSGAGRPLGYETGSKRLANILGGVGGLFQGIGSFGNFGD